MEILLLGIIATLQGALVVVNYLGLRRERKENLPTALREEVGALGAIVPEALPPPSARPRKLLKHLPCASYDDLNSPGGR